MRCRILIFFLLITGTLRADYVWTSRCKEAYAAVSELNFNKAAQLLAEEKAANPGNLIPLYIENQSDFFRTFISEEPQTLEILKKNTDIRISKLEKAPENKYKKLLIGEMYLQLAIGRLKFEEFFTAVYDVKKANRYLNENQKQYPTFSANLRGLGFIHTIAGSIPKNFQWVINMLGISGTVKQGLGELQTLLAISKREPEFSYLEDETVLMLTFLELTLDKKEQNNERISARFSHVKNIEKKPLLQFSKAVFHISQGDNDSVLAVLSNRKYEAGSYPLHYLDFMEGTARMNKMDFTADRYLDKYLTNYKGRSYVYAAWQRRAWIRLLQNDLKGYREMMSHCKGDEKGEGLTDEDKQALKDARNNDVPNIILLRCRLYFDGGYYTSALQAIGGQPSSAFPTTEDKLELTYRLARIFEKTEKKDKAEYYYLETYKNGKNTTYYFAANSCLMLARMYEDEGNMQQAILYYKKTLELRDHDYQTALTRKQKQDYHA